VITLIVLLLAGWTVTAVLAAVAIGKSIHLADLRARR